MLIRFDSKAGSFLMMSEIAVPLLGLAGHSGMVPGAFLAKDIPPALVALKAAVVNAPPPVDPEDESEEGLRREAPVTLRQRAFPLIDLLERAARQGQDVTWQAVSPEDAYR